MLILGRQPALGLAELESLYGADRVESAGDSAAVVDIDPCLLAFDRLGGSMKFCKVLTLLETTEWKQVEKFLVQTSPSHARQMPEGKMHLGLSLYGYDENVRQIEATGLNIKKAIRKDNGRSVRLVPNKTSSLNTAQVLHNKLLSQNGWELIFVKDGVQTIVAQTVKAQNIESYTRRDRGRPKRDTRVGMLPPKLAQVIINLAVGQLPKEKLASICEIPAGKAIPSPSFHQTILDPFCGTGVVLQEARLMGYKVAGSDIEPRMVDYTRQNLDWLADTHGLPKECWQVEAGDATNYRWPAVDFVAGETYLGRPFTSPPSPEVLAQTMANCNLIIKKFLQNIYRQLKPGARLCLAVPAWQIRPGHFKHLPLVDQIADLGYNCVSFEQAKAEQLLYYREDQIVARQLLIVTRK